VSGHIYERRLIEKYIKENGSDPMNGEKLGIEMLVDVKGLSWSHSKQNQIKDNQIY
jgi:pre-mRNA-processing factor 19